MNRRHPGTLTNAWDKTDFFLLISRIGARTFCWSTPAEISRKFLLSHHWFCCLTIRSGVRFLCQRIPNVSGNIRNGFYASSEVYPTIGYAHKSSIPWFVFGEGWDQLRSWSHLCEDLVYSTLKSSSYSNFMLYGFTINIFLSVRSESGTFPKRPILQSIIINYLSWCNSLVNK